MWRPQRELKPTAGPAELGGRRKVAGFRRAGGRTRRAGGSSTQLASSGPLPASYAGWLFAKAPDSAPPSPCSVRRVCPPHSAAHHHPCAPCSHFPDLHGVCRTLGGALRLGEEVQHRSLTHTHDRGSTPGSWGGLMNQMSSDRRSMMGITGPHTSTAGPSCAQRGSRRGRSIGAAWRCPLSGATVQYSQGVPKGWDGLSGRSGGSGRSGAASVRDRAAERQSVGEGGMRASELRGRTDIKLTIRHDMLCTENP
jgi:hypothetical protein